MRRLFKSAPVPVCLAALIWSSVGHAAAQTNTAPGKFDCSEVLSRLRTDFAKDPGRVVLAVEDALTSHEACACPIVRTAVDLCGRETDLTVKILLAAIHMVPSASATITECVLQEAPGAAPAIRLALAKELGEGAPAMLGEIENNDKNPNEATAPGADTSPTASKEQGKSPLPAPPAIEPTPRETEDEYSDEFPGVGYTGIFFSGRATPAGGQKGTKFPDLHEKMMIKRTIIKVRRPIFPVTRSIPD